MRTPVVCWAWLDRPDCTPLCVCVCVCVCVCACLVISNSLVTPWTVACQAPLSMEFSRQEYWSGLPFPPPRDLPDLGIEPGAPTVQVDSLASEPPGKPLNKGRCPVSVEGNRAVIFILCSGASSSTTWDLARKAGVGPMLDLQTQTLWRWPSNLCFNKPAEKF